MDCVSIANKLMRRFLPDGASPYVAFRVRAGGEFIAAALPVGLLLVALGGLLDAALASVLGWVLVFSLLAAGFGVLAWWRRSMHWLLHGLGMLTALFALGWSVRVGGPAGALPLLWLAAVPAIMRGVAGRGCGRAWCLVTLALLLAWPFTDWLWRELGIQEGSELSPTALVVCVTGVTLILASLMAVCERARGESLEGVEATGRSLDRAADDALRVQRQRGDLLVRMSRMLRSPLSSLVEVVEHLVETRSQDSESSGPVADSGQATAAHSSPLATVERNVRRLQATLEMVVDVAEVEAGTLRLRFSRCSVRKLAEELLSAMQAKAEAQGRTLELELGSDAPELVDTDPARLKQVLGAVMVEAIENSAAPAFRLVIGARDGRLSFDVVEVLPDAAAEGEVPGSKLGPGAEASGRVRPLARAEEVARVRLAGLVDALQAELARRDDSGASDADERDMDANIYARVTVAVQASQFGSVPMAGAGVRGAAAGGAPAADRATRFSTKSLADGHIEALALARPAAWRWNVLLGCLALAISVGAWWLGGPSSPIGLCIVLLPIAAAFGLGCRRSLGWIAYALLFSTLGTGLFEDLRVGLIGPMPYLALEPMYSLALIVVALSAYLAVGLYDRGTCAALRELERAQARVVEEREAIEETERQKACVCLQVGHEIRTPLTTILGFADVLIEQAQGARRGRGEARERIDSTPLTRRRLADLRRHGRRMLALIETWSQLVELGVRSLSAPARGDAADEALRDAIQFSPAEVLLQVIERVEDQAIDGVFEVEGVLESPLPDWVIGDAVRCEQALYALAEHALTVVEEGVLRVTGSLQTSGIQPRLVLRVERIELADSAVPAAESSVADGGEGVRLDLHLSLCKRLADHLGGRLELGNLSRRGAAVCISFPVEACSLDAEADDSDCAEQQSLDPAPSKLEMRVLVAEDGEDNRRLISHLLKRLGAEAVMVENGEYALRRALFAEADHEPFDAVLMDLQMPEVDGYEATRTLRDAGFLKPVIALTAHATDLERERCKEAGFDGFAIKPCDQNSLLTALVEARARTRAATPKGSHVGQ